MKRTIFLVLLLAVVAWPQVTSKAELTWNASLTPGVTYNVYHSPAPVGQFIKVNTAPVTGLLFDDTVNTSGFWTVTAVLPDGSESVMSTSVTLPNPVSGLKVVGK